MPKIEEGKRFTDLAYASKDEVKAIYNKDDISKEWGKVLSYRSFFTTDTELRDEEENAYFLVLSPSVLKACYQLEERLFQDLLLFLSLSEEGKTAFRLKRKKHALAALARHALEKMPSDSTIERIAANEIENVPTSLFLLGEYSQAYDESMPSTDEGLFALNNRIQGEKEDSAPLMRKDRKEDVINTLTLPSPEKVTPHLTSYFLFLQQKDIPLLARAVLSLYFFLSVRPMEYVNEETATLFAKNLLRKLPEARMLTILYNKDEDPLSIRAYTAESPDDVLKILRESAETGAAGRFRKAAVIPAEKSFRFERFPEIFEI